jgi:uncharacterized lipoprotein YajG
MFMKKIGCLVSSFLLLLALSACAEKGPVLLDNIRYQAPEGGAATPSKMVVALSPFKDMRGKTASVLGKRTIREYVQNDLVVQGTVADLVMKGFQDALQARGITVKDVSAWDMDAETAEAGGADILVGGEIKALWVDVVSEPLNVKTRAEVQLRVAAADAAQKKFIRTLTVSSKMDRQDVAFSFESVEDAVSEALSGAINQFLNDEEFKKRMQ